MLSRAIGSLGRFFIGVAVVLFLFAAFQLWGTGFQEARAQNSLTSEFDALLTDTDEDDIQEVVAAIEAAAEADGAGDADGLDPAELVDDNGLPFDPELVKLFLPDGGDPIARLDMPTIGESKIVVEGVQVEDLRQGPGHYRSTPGACQAGNVAIAGHRTTYGQPFHNIDQLTEGDEITLQSVQGKCTYRVITPEKPNYDTGEYCLDFEQDRVERISSGFGAAAIEGGLIDLQLPQDFAAGATDDITYFDTSAQQVGDSAPVPTAASDTPGAFIVDPKSTCVIENYGDNRLTLTACHPKFSARQRIVVQAILIGDPFPSPNIARSTEAEDLASEDLASEFDDPTSTPTSLAVDGAPATTEAGVAQPSSLADLLDSATAGSADADALDAGLGWSWEFLPAAALWGALTLALWIATRVVARRWRTLPTFALAAAPLLFGLFLTFEQVDKILPAV